MKSQARYVPNGDNSLLRHVLCEVWKLQCYWCRRVKEDYLDFQIDHILPQTSTNEERERLKKKLKLEDDYDVHAVENLAPICSACNGRKSNDDFTDYPMILTALKRARREAPSVRRRVETFGKSAELGGALLLAINADLDDANNRATFEEVAPAVVQRLAELGPEKAGFFTVQDLLVEGRDASYEVSVRLDEEGRTAVTVLEAIAGGVLKDVLVEPLSDLLQRLVETIARQFEDHDDGMGAPSAGSIDIDWPVFVVDKASFEAGGGAELFFEFEGACQGAATGSVTRTSADGEELEDVQGEASFASRFVFNIYWSPEHPHGGIAIQDVSLDGFDADSWLDGEPSFDWSDFTTAEEEEAHLHGEDVGAHEND